MSYITASLAANETVLHTTKLSLWQFLPHFLMALVLIFIGSAAKQPLPVLVVITDHHCMGSCAGMDYRNGRDQ